MSTPPFELSGPAPRQDVYRAAFVAGLLLLFAGVSVQYSYKALHNRSAFVRQQSQVLAVDEGADITKRFNYPYPPVMAVLLLPIASLPPVPGALTWFYLKVGMTLLAIPWVFRLVADPDRPFPAAAQAAAVLLSLMPILGDLQHGNVNLFILFLVVAALVAFRARRDALSGILLGLAISCKVTPALFVPYLVWKRAWRALAGVAIGLALFLWPGVVPALRLGLAENQQQLVSWYREMVYPFVVEGKVTSEHENQSLPGVVYRLTTASPSFSTYVNDVYTPTEYDNFLNLDRGSARWLLKGCMAAFALLAVWTCRTPTDTRQGWRLAAEYSLVVLGMLLFSERTWKHHCVTLLLPFAVLCYYLAACRPRPAVARGVIAVLVVCTLLMTATSTTVFYRDLAKHAQVYGAYTAANVLLAGTLFFVLLTGQGRATRPSDTPRPVEIAPTL
jgi:hypothetical protein